MATAGGRFGHVRVCVRLRPLQPHELKPGDDAVALRVGGDGVTLHAVVSKAGDRETIRQFSFDAVAPPTTTQQQFFEACGVASLIDNALNGINATIFAYGQTGSGKTFTMSGNEERLVARSLLAADAAAGIIPRCVAHLFHRVATEPGDVHTVVRASFCEIYNEQIFDLLNLTGEPLPLRFNTSLGYFAQGMLVVQCDTVDEVMAVVTEGHRNRTVGSHALNLDSSRSHSLLTLMLERTTTDPDTGQTTLRRSKVMCVDLAGSERLKESKSDGLSALETRQINRSLFALGKVIAALADRRNRAPPGAAPPLPASSSTVPGGGGPLGRGSGVGVGLMSPGGSRPRATSSLMTAGSAALAGAGTLASGAARASRERVSSAGVGLGGPGGAGASVPYVSEVDGPIDPHIPYRDSKLTKLLMDALGGNAMTIMIACVSPAAAFLDESLNTLQYAMRASKIENAPVIHIDTKDAVIAALRKENKRLRWEMEVLRSAMGLPADMPVEEAVAWLHAHGGVGGSPSRSLSLPPSAGTQTTTSSPRHPGEAHPGPWALVPGMDAMSVPLHVSSPPPSLSREGGNGAGLPSPLSAAATPVHTPSSASSTPVPSGAASSAETATADWNRPPLAGGILLHASTDGGSGEEWRGSGASAGGGRPVRASGSAPHPWAGRGRVRRPGGGGGGGGTTPAAMPSARSPPAAITPRGTVAAGPGKSELERVRAQWQQSSAALEVAQAQVASLTAASEEAKATITSLERQVADTATDRAASDALAASLQSEVEELKEANTLLELRLQALQQRGVEVATPASDGAGGRAARSGGGTRPSGSGRGGGTSGAGGSYAARVHVARGMGGGGPVGTAEGGPSSLPAPAPMTGTVPMRR